MHEHTDHNALLLQVMAHDLLAPLTAIKWQLELLARQGVQSSKGEEYLRSLTQSTELGITLTKHAHVAGRVLVGSYALDATPQSLPAVVERSAQALSLQYERHGVTLEVNVDAEPWLRTFDAELVAAFVWSIAKFFLTSAPPQATVSIRGMSVPDAEASTYVIMCSVSGIPEVEACVSAFNSVDAKGAYDQSYVFAKLARDVARLLGVDVAASVQGTGMLIEASFSGPVVPLGTA
jgi:K+-sensing histidine kinase KdpD